MFGGNCLIAVVPCLHMIVSYIYGQCHVITWLWPLLSWVQNNLVATFWIHWLAILKLEKCIIMWVKAKGFFLRPVQPPGSYWDRSSGLPLVGLEPHRGDSLWLDAKLANPLSHQWTHIIRETLFITVISLWGKTLRLQSWLDFISYNSIVLSVLRYHNISDTSSRNLWDIQNDNTCKIYLQALKSQIPVDLSLTKACSIIIWNISTNLQ